MYDTREKAIRDQQWIMNAARREAREEGLQEGREVGLQEGREVGREEGREEGEIKLIRTLQEILGGPVSDTVAFQGRSLEQLRAMTEELRNKIQRRT